MGMPRKGSRKVEVDGGIFLWRVSGYTRYWKESPVALTLTCQRDEERPGRVMQVSLRSIVEIDDYSLEHGMHRATLHPSEVQQIIAHALRGGGWNPSERGGAFELEPRARQPEPSMYRIVKMHSTGAD